MGTYKKHIDWEKVALFLKSGCTQGKIAKFFNVTRETLVDRSLAEHGETWDLYSARMRASGEMMLEVKQFQQAMSGNTKMLIHLGKHRLGQTDAINFSVAPFQNEIDSEHERMMLKHRVKELLDKVKQYEPDYSVPGTPTEKDFENADKP